MKGLQAGDQFISVNGQAVAYMHEVTKLVKGKLNTPFSIVIKRTIPYLLIFLPIIMAF